MKDKNITPTDYHEAGHVLVALLEGYRNSIEHVQMTYDEKSRSVAHVRIVERPDEVGGISAFSDFKKVAINMAGIAAELVTREAGEGMDTYLHKMRQREGDMYSARHNALSMCMRDIKSNAIERRFESAIGVIQAHAPDDWHAFKATATYWLEKAVNHSKSERTPLEYQMVDLILDDTLKYDIDLINQHREELDAIAELLSQNDFVDYSQIRDVVPHLCS